MSSQPPVTASSPKVTPTATRLWTGQYGADPTTDKASTAAATSRATASSSTA